MTDYTYAPERGAFLVRCNGSLLGGVESYRLKVERKCTPTQTVGGGQGTLLCAPALYTVTLSRFLPDCIAMPTTLGALLSEPFTLSIVRENRTESFEECRVQSSTETIDANGRVLEELVCVSQKRTHSDAHTEV